MTIVSPVEKAWKAWSWSDDCSAWGDLRQVLKAPNQWTRRAEPFAPDAMLSPVDVGLSGPWGDDSHLRQLSHFGAKLRNPHGWLTSNCPSISSVPCRLEISCKICGEGLGLVRGIQTLQEAVSPSFPC